MDFQQKEKYSLEDLLKIVEMLRGPTGCPWDQKQNHHSIRSNLIEETYEVVEAIDSENTILLKEELGDLLLQVVFHAQMEDEKGSFGFDEVCDGICKKLVFRHPHVFGDEVVSSADEALNTWEQMKKREKQQHSASAVLDQVSKALPSLMYSLKVQKRAVKYGFDYADAGAVMKDFRSEVVELEEAISNGDVSNMEMEMGDILFSAVNLSRELGIDPEKALYDSTAKFVSRVKTVEVLANQRGMALGTVDQKDLDNFWNEAKNIR